VTFFIIAEYLNSLYPVKFLGTGYFFEWLDLQSYENFKIFYWDRFYRDKIFILVMVSVRRQIFYFVDPISEIQWSLNKEYLKEKSGTFNALFKAIDIF